VVAAPIAAETSADRKGPASHELDRGQLNVGEARGKSDLDHAIAELARRAEDAGFTDLGVLVDLSARQVERSSFEGDVEAQRDLANAEANLTRVLAIDEHSPSAANQLALVHLAKAKRLGRLELERAMGVCLWATRENPTFAPLLNTVGLVEFELRDVAGAIRSFEAAVRLDPSYFEAQTNLGASLLFARKFEDAERVYERMIAERPEYAKEIRLAKQRVRDLGGAVP
jgi:tetratricopeptide (TPR) repeat protein